ncbi:MAG: hypothetical protein OXF09_01415 [Hyphomicrobiales bacterium]|nr:hypothetical protein [Hyphomicrobiales bacterium]
MRGNGIDINAAPEPVFHAFLIQKVGADSHVRALSLFFAGLDKEQAGTVMGR